FPGGTQALNRRELWDTKRVFFLTPQIMVNDLSRGTCPADKIKCLVIDEAHKALGNHAYCQVVRELSKYTNQFRILALSATPGSDTKAVQQVISNLLIAQIEQCAEDSLEIQPYSHERQVEKIIVPLGEELVEMQNTYIRVLETFAGRLIKIGVLARRDIPSLTKYQIILARDQYRKNPSSRNVGIHQGIVEGDFALCISLYHGYELLLQMGARSLFIYLYGIMDGYKGLARTKNELGRNEDFMNLYQQLRDKFSDTSLSSASGNVYKSETVLENKREFIYGHPKLRKLEEIVIEHFKSRKMECSVALNWKGEDLRLDIRKKFFMLGVGRPWPRLPRAVVVAPSLEMLKARLDEAWSYLIQWEVVKRFREGGYNTLVSTCVGEEGLDIGEVDLIICFDAQKSPIRLVQRMGRTGRKRQGRIVVILAEGREERTYNQSQSNKRSIHKAISGNKMLHFYKHSPRVIPEGVNPKLHKMFITAEKYEPSSSRAHSKERRSGSLQHKSALFASQTPCHENCFLSPEEFETWDRLYRIKESDGIKQPTLPPIQFETLENLEETSKHKEEATHELSLSEWRLWQNRPFPTAMVDHSDRCYHFISIMEMIERMRDEQGDCSYEQEIRPHLCMEDVHVRRDKSHLSTTSSTFEQKPHSFRKDLVHELKVKPFVPDTNDKRSKFFSTFKILKTSKRTSGLNSEGPVLPMDTNASGSCSAGRLALSENADQGSQKDEELEVMFDLNACIAMSDNGNAVIPGSAARKEYSTADKACPALGTDHTDSGYSSLSAEKSPGSSHLFYLPEPHMDSFALARPSEGPVWLTEVISRVKRLLAQSPPSLNKLYDCENTIRDEEPVSPFQKVIPDGYSERPQDEVFSASSEAQCSLLPFKNPRWKVTREPCASVSTSLSKPLASPENAAVKAREELPWDDSFDSLFDDEFTEIQNENPAMNHTLTNNPSHTYSAQEEEGDLEMDKNNVISEEKTAQVSDDRHISDAEEGSFSVNKEHLVSADSGEGDARLVAERGPIWFPSDECSVDTAQTCEELPASRKPTAMADLGVTRQVLDNDDDLYDCSQELFSVTFDLGFSIEECEDEIFEEEVNTDNTKKLGGALGSSVDVKSTEDKTKSLNDSSRPEMSPKWDHKSLERKDISTPLPFQSRSMNGPEGTKGASTAVPCLMSGDGRTGGGAPEALASALPTPTSRKVLNFEATKRIPMCVFPSAREEIPEVSHSDTVPKNRSPHRQNCGSSAMDALDSSLRTESLEDPSHPSSRVPPAQGTSSESEEEIVFQRKNRRINNVLKSPEVMNDSDLESPIRAFRKRQRPLTVVSMSFGRVEERNTHSFEPRSNQNLVCFFLSQSAARQFLDEEAELSQEGAGGVSSDESEDTEGELNSSLAQFLNDDAEVTQVLKESEMRGIYLKSVRSPALGNRYKMVHREFNSMAIFSQIPEQDSAYVEDSFCVGEEEKETCKTNDSSEEELCVNFDLLNNESFTSGRKQYLTRRRKKLHQARMEEDPSVPAQKRKPSRIIVLSDSSGEETSISTEKPLEPSGLWAAQGDRIPESLPSVPPAQRRAAAEEIGVHRPAGRSTIPLGPTASVAETSNLPPNRHVWCKHCDLQHLQVEGSVRNPCGCTVVALRSAHTTPSPAPALFPHEPLLRILVDSREISSGAEVISALKAVHRVKVQVCSLSSTDYIISNRLAVERRFLSELLTSANRNKLSQRIQHLRSMFERICVIVEKDRTKPGETSRFLQRTQNYDAVLSALVRSGVRILFSSCQEETATLLKDLALVEHRKNAAIHVPMEVEGHKREMLSFYLTLPNLSYLAALNLCHSFGSIREMANSSPQDLAAGAQVSPQTAAEIHRYLHYGFEAQMLPESPCTMAARR
ncbi:FANCM protein, partial [Ceuthmochares aereus]|nr:FANCM protein [Ceuthmochares aereus]